MRFAKKIISVALVTCVVTPLYADIENRIIGGVDVDKEDWPSMVGILMADDSGAFKLYDRQFCGGNLINKRWVLSAAHCFFEEKTTNNFVQIDASSLNVVVGIDYLESDASTVEYDVKRIITHNKYDPSNVASQNDIALLELTTAAPGPIMEIFTSETLSGTQATVIGWGATEYDPWDQISTGFPKQLKGVDVPIVSNSVCRQSYGDIINSSQLCAGEAQGGVDSCQGDSGGPLMISENGVYKQAGVVSFGNGCALADFYGVYTRTSSFTGWISGYVVDGLDTNGGGSGANPGAESDDSKAISGIGASYLYPLLLSLFGLLRVAHRRLFLVVE